MDKKKFADCMKRNREKQNISIEDLSTMTDISIKKLEEFETGEFERIKASEIKSIGYALNIPIVVFMHGGGTVEFLFRDEKGRPICKWRTY